MKFYINICKLDLEEQECNEVDCCRNIFWQKDIEISEHFYIELSKHKEVMLIPSMHKNDNLILNFDSYFKKTIEFTVIGNEKFSDKSILICELSSYFEPDYSDDRPF